MVDDSMGPVDKPGLAADAIPVTATSSDALVHAPAPRADVNTALQGCCVATIKQHVRFNPMMVCSECKNIIKCFTEERAFQNYLTFCRSRRRPVLTAVIEGHFTVAFRSYDTFQR